MEFRFNLKNVFNSPISKINYTLLPFDFSGDKRNALNSTSLVADVIDQMGIASAKAQGLQQSITSSEKMRNFDHLIYLMVDHNYNNGKGCVVGLLKVGIKNLFLFDQTGMVHEKKSLCILDFYVHESKQRNGFGKKLFDFMLQDKNIEPCKLAIDKPSVKFLSFLYRHYGLEKIFPQNNNFLVFEGFFDVKSDVSEQTGQTHTDHSFISEHFSRNGMNTGTENNKCVDSGGYSPLLHGRHSAFKPQDSMGKCLGMSSPHQNGQHLNSTHHTALW